MMKRIFSKYPSITLVCSLLSIIALIVAFLSFFVFVPQKNYHMAQSLISEKKYEEADSYLEGNSWKDSSTQIIINKARKSFDENDYVSGFDVLSELNVKTDIVYDLDGGKGDIKSINTIPEKDGYSFDKWIVNSYSIDGCDTNYNTTVELKAIWILNSYTIIYFLNGGECVNPDSYTVESDSFILNNPTKNGYHFKGWVGTNISIPTNKVTISKGTVGNLSFYATWEANTNTIYLDSNGGECSIESIATIYNEEYILPIPSRNGYLFIGWFENDVEWNSGVWNHSSDITLKAKWEPKKFKLSFDLNGGKSLDLPEEYSFTDEDILIANPYLEGYEFLGWLGTGLTEPIKNLIIKQYSQGDKYFDAQWDGLTYQISFDPNGGVLDAPYNKTAVFGNYCELPVPYKFGYSFSGWACNGELIGNNLWWNIPNDVILVAQWTTQETTYVSKQTSGPNVFSSFKTGCEHAYRNGNSLIVLDGVYDLVEEFGKDYLDSLESSPLEESGFGCPIGNGMTIDFRNGSKLVFNYTGGNKITEQYFSPLHLMSVRPDVKIHNAIIDCYNCRYAIHLEALTYPYHYENVISNCVLYHNNSTSDSGYVYTYPCIGMGTGIQGNISIENNICTSVPYLNPLQDVDFSDVTGIYNNVIDSHLSGGHSNGVFQTINNNWISGGGIRLCSYYDEYVNYAMVMGNSTERDFIQGCQAGTPMLIVYESNNTTR